MAYGHAGICGDSRSERGRTVSNCSGSETNRATDVLSPRDQPSLTEFTAESGRLVLVDAMTHPGDREEGDPAGREYREILRRIECAEGEAEVEILCAPRFNYGQEAPRVSYLEEGVLFEDGSGEHTLYLRLLASVAKLEIEGATAGARVALRPGETAWASLSYNPKKRLAHIGFRALDEKERWEDTERYWRSWVGRGSYPQEYRDNAVRSALVTQLLRYAETGASVASPTTSLPEVIGGRRSYDYRFAWVGDGSLGLAVLSILGYLDEAQQTMRWLASLGSETKAPLQVVYSVRGDRRLEQEEIVNLLSCAGPRSIGPRVWRV